MQNLDTIAEELFNKIRGRFPTVTIGDEEGNVTNEPTQARYFDFDFVNEGRPVGKISVSLNDKSIAVVYGQDLVANETDITKNSWYDFLKELRMFARKRALTFDTRDITKSNLNSRDYKFLATNRGGEDKMNESKLYGTSRVSYQDFDGARLVIKHTESINPELATGRIQKIGAIYIESAEGERFKYPYRHVTGARAMARHVAEGGNAYDDFGKYIVGLSEELGKLRKFKTYMGRSSVMAESLAEYMDVVKERIGTVKKTLESLQRQSHYKEAFESFELPVMEEVPADVASNWIDQLTIRQFNEELKDVFPYIYKLVSEATRAKELTAEDLVDEAGKLKGGADDPCWKGYQMVGTKKKGGKEVPNCVPREEMELESMFDDILGQFNEGDDDKEELHPETLELIDEYIAKIEPDADRDELIQSVIDGHIHTSELEYALQDMDEAKGKDHDKDGDIDSDDYMKSKDIAIKKAMGKDDKEKEVKEQQAPLSEFILSYFDRETGQFPKGETAVLTMVEKDYGEQYIEPAKQFIERLYQVVEQYREPEVSPEMERMRELAGLR